MQDTVVHTVKVRCNLTDTSAVFTARLTDEEARSMGVLAQILCEGTDWDFNLVITRTPREDADHDGMHTDVTSR